MKKTKIISTLTFVCIISLLLTLGAVVPASSSPVSGLVGRWHLDNKFGTALEFDGVDDYIEVSDSVSLDLINEITLEAWIMYSGTGLQSIISKKTLKENNYGFFLNNKKLSFQYRKVVDGTITYHWYTSNLEIPENMWVHVAATYKTTESASMHLYMNNEELGGTWTMGDGTDMLYANDAPLLIGAWEKDGGALDYFFDGVIDEIRISNCLRANFDICNRLEVDTDTVALWHFDDGVGQVVADETGYNNGQLGSTTGVDTEDPTWVDSTLAIDSSCNGNFGTVYDAVWVDGLFGKALCFDGSGDYVEISDSTSLDVTDQLTVEAWVKFDPSALGEDSVIVRKGDAFSLQKYTDDKIEGWVKIGTQWKGVRGESGGIVLTSNVWYHLAFTYDGSEVKTYVNGVLDRIGSHVGTIDSTSKNAWMGLDRELGYDRAELAGCIDEARIWSSALSNEELKKHAWGLVGEWDFNEGSGTDAFDSSGFGNDGVLLPTGSEAAWVDGRFDGVSDYALDFDGTNDYVGIPVSTSLDLTAQITVEAWIKLDVVGGTIIRKGAYPITDPAPTWGFDIPAYLGGKLRAFIYDEGTAYVAEGSTTLVEDNWYHVAFTYDGSAVRLYLNGVDDGSQSHSGDIDSSDSPVWISRKDEVDYFEGKIDEVHIWNQALVPITFDQTGLDASATGELVVTVKDPISLDYEYLPFIMMVPSGVRIEYTFEDTVPSSDVGKGFTLVGVSGPVSPVTVTSPTTVVGNYFKWLTVSGTKYEAAFFDDFSEPDGPAIGWTVADYNSPLNSWSVNSEEYCQEGIINQAYTFPTAGDESWTDYIVEADIQFQSDTATSDTYGGLCFRLTTGADPPNTLQCYWAGIHSDDSIEVWKLSSGQNWVELAHWSGYTFDFDWHHLKIVVSGDTFTINWDGTDVGTVTDSSYGNGKIGLHTAYNRYVHCHFDNVFVKKPLSGWHMKLYKDSVQYGTDAITDSQGEYQFTVKHPGDYEIKEVLPTGWTKLYPGSTVYGTGAPVLGYAFTAESGVDVPGNDFVNFEWFDISGQKFYDADGGGVKDPFEPGLDNWVIRLEKDGEPVCDPQITSPDGMYVFADIKLPGVYLVYEDGLSCDSTPDGWRSTGTEEYVVIALSGLDVEDLDFGNTMGESVVTTSGLCWFDRDEAEGRQFRVIFTPDVANDPNEYKVSATNPGQFYYNIFYSGDVSEPFVISLPDAFETQGATPVHVYSSLNTGPCGCLIPGDDISDLFTINLDGNPITVTPVDGYSGFVYITVHRDYSPKQSGGYEADYYSDGVNGPIYANAINDDPELDDILDLYGYTFRVTGPVTDSQTIENRNCFKKFRGIIGFVTDQYGDPIEDVTVTITSDALEDTVVLTTDEDGFYGWSYFHKGKPATYYVNFGYETVEIELKAGRFAEVSYQTP